MKKRGFGLVEVLIGASILGASLVGMVAAYNRYLRASFVNTDSIKAAFLLEEGLEAVRSLRDDGWDMMVAPLAVGTNYFLAFENGKWKATTINIFLDSKFERRFVFADVYRDGNDDIVSSGTLDTGTRKVTVTVSWATTYGTSTKTIASYITDMFE
ncbi:MAG: hypothetical protein Q7S15_01705 [bacterium]|nr:hypothetical protein [bacterium]